MNQTEQAALLSIMVMCGVVAAVHILAALYLLHRAGRKAQAQQDLPRWGIPNKNQELIDLISGKAQEHQEKRQKRKS